MLRLLCDHCPTYETVPFATFRELPLGWEYTHGKHLCPACVREYKEFTKGFLNPVPPPRHIEETP